MAQTDGDTPRELFLIDGNSLAYRAFFALPESIATSDGRPTNAIFGFASMLVKILTDYGEVPTVVVWDAGMSGRKEISADYKAQRSTRPDLLKLQWPHLGPLVEAFGYSNISVEGFEADDVIAALVEQARERDIPVMVVTGDRDAYQLVRDGVRIMTTSRGITDTKVYDTEGVIERYGIPPEKIPDFIGLKGDTSDNIPGVPGIGDKTASELLQRFGDLETVLASVDEISGAKRKQNLIEHADAARLSKQLATMVRDVPIDLDLEAELSKVPDRANLRTVFRDWELRDPLRRLEEALFEAEAEAIPRPEAAEARTVPVKTGATAADVARLQGDELYLVAVAPEAVEGELIPREQRWRFGAYAGGGQALAGEVDDPAELVAAAGDRPVVAHDAKALGTVPGNLVFDTELAAYLLDPARRGFPLDELCRGARPRRRGRGRERRPRRARPRPRGPAARAAERARADRPAQRHRAPARARPARGREGRHQARHQAARGGREPDPQGRPGPRARDLGHGRRGVHDRLAAAARRGAVRQARPQPQAPRQDRLQHRRPRAAGDPRRASDHPQDRALPGADQARADLPRRAAGLDRRTTAACTRRSCRRTPRPAGSRRSTRTSRTSRSARRPGA